MVHFTAECQKKGIRERQRNDEEPSQDFLFPIASTSLWLARILFFFKNQFH